MMEVEMDRTRTAMGVLKEKQKRFDAKYVSILSSLALVLTDHVGADRSRWC
jgi:hypothetical protein